MSGTRRMNRPLKLSLAVALALASSHASALGLGPIEVKSKMNEPLSADIAVLEGGSDEMSNLKAQLAGAEDMKRVGVDSSSLTVPLDFSVMQGPKGRTVIHVTSSEPIRDPFVSFLVEVNWGKGKLLREYNVLLDPPVTAPVIATRAVAAPAKEPERVAAKPATPAEPKPAQLPAAPPPAQAKPEAEPAPAKATAKPAAAKPEPKPEAPPAPKPEARPAAPAPAAASASGEYGPVASGETLWEIANRTKPQNSGVNQMMVALLSANPNAFYKDNVNALKRGAVMRIPGSDEVRKLSSAEAQAAIAAQNQAWTAGTAAPPMKIADSGKPSAPPPPSSAAAPATSKPSRLELVPPKAGTGKSGADKPGAAGGTDTSATRADLTRVKEQLASKEQEATDLRSRVSDLEKIKADNERLISLKNTQIAELQTRLADLNRQIDQQKRELAKVQAAPAAPATAKTEPPKPEPAKVEPPKSEPAKPEPVKTEPVKPEAVTASPPKVENPPKAEPPVVVPPTASESKNEPASETKVTPLAESKPATPVPAAEPAPAPSGEPWFENPLVLGGVGAALLLGAIALLMGRRRKPEGDVVEADMEAPSLGDEFSGGPFGAGPGVAAATAADDEELELLERLAQDPTDDEAHLALLRMYYERQDADKFEPAASAFYAQHPDEGTWEKVSAMGRELLPGNLMFAEPLEETQRMPAIEPVMDDASTRHDLDFDFGLH